MLKHWRQSLFFIHCLIFFLAANLPINLVLERIQLPQQVRVYQPSGTLFNGGFSQLQINQLSFQQLQFSWQASCLLSLQWCYRISIPEGQLLAAVNFSGQTIEVTEMDVEFPASDFVATMPNLLVNPTGRVRLQGSEITFRDSRPESVQAVMLWSDLGVEAGSDSLVVGNYLAEISGQGDRIDFILSDNSALLQASGGGSIFANGRYELDISLSSQDVIPDRLKSILELLARPAGYNQYRINQQGSDRRLRW